MADVRIENNLNTTATVNVTDSEAVADAKKNALEATKKEEALITSTAIENSKVEADVLATVVPKAVSKAANADKEDETPLVTDEMIENLEKLEEKQDGSVASTKAAKTKAPEIAATNANITAAAYASSARPQQLQDNSGKISAVSGNPDENQNTNNKRFQISDNNADSSAYSTDALRYSAMANSSASGAARKPVSSDETTDNTVNNSKPQRKKSNDFLQTATDVINGVADVILDKKKVDVKTDITKTDSVPEVKPQTVRPSEKKDDPVNYLKEKNRESAIEHFKDQAEGKGSEAKINKKEKLKQEIEQEAKTLNKIFSQGKQSVRSTSAAKRSGKAGNKKEAVKVEIYRDKDNIWRARKPNTIEFQAHDSYMMKQEAEYLKKHPEPTFSGHLDELSEEEIRNGKLQENGEKTTGFEYQNRKTYFSEHKQWKIEYTKHMSALEKDYQANNKDYQEQYFAYRKAQLKAEELNKKSK